jgi:chromosome segregation ATPase
MERGVMSDKKVDLSSLPGWFPVSAAEFQSAMNSLGARLDRLERTTKSVDDHVIAVEHATTHLGEMILSTQDDVDALTTALTAEDAELNAGVTSLQASVAAIATLLQAPSIDVSALQAEAANSQSLADAIKAAVASAAALVPPATS